MGRRKKFNWQNILIAILGIALLVWVAADFYNNSKNNKKEEEPAQNSAIETQNNIKTPDQKNEEQSLEIEKDSKFKLVIYKNSKYGFEIQYPVAVNNDPQCAKLVETQDGFSLGIFSLAVSPAAGELKDFASEQLAGMEIDNKTDLMVGGQNAIKADYQTAGMTWSGSDTFIKCGNQIFDFGLIANTAPNKCAGDASYEDKVYQSVISTLKFVNCANN